MDCSMREGEGGIRILGALRTKSVSSEIVEPLLLRDSDGEVILSIPQI